MGQTVVIAIKDLRFTEKKRRGVCARRVEELRRELEDGRDMTPIKVHALGDGTYVVEDGRHRIKAHLAAGVPFILAYVKDLIGRMLRWLFGQR